MTAYSSLYELREAQIAKLRDANLRVHTLAEDLSVAKERAAQLSKQVEDLSHAIITLENRE